MIRSAVAEPMSAEFNRTNKILLDIAMLPRQQQGRHLYTTKPQLVNRACGEGMRWPVS
jgi:hypothetical protein